MDLIFCQAFYPCVPYPETRMYDTEDLPDRAVEVLITIDDYPRPTTTTIRESHHWADKNQHIHYRLNQLEEKGLIETWNDDGSGGRGALAPRRTALTDDGENLLEHINEGAKPDTIEERVDKLEKKMINMQKAYGKVKGRIKDLEEEVEEHDEDLDDVAEEIENVKRFLTEQIED